PPSRCPRRCSSSTSCRATSWARWKRTSSARSIATSSARGVSNGAKAMATGDRRAEQRWLSALPLPGWNGFLTSLADAGREVWRGRRQSPRGGAGAAMRLCHELLSTAGEASGMAIAREILDLYEAMGEAEKQGFRAALVVELGVDAGEIERAARRFATAPDPGNLAALGRAVEPRRQVLFRRLNTAPG